MADYYELPLDSAELQKLNVFSNVAIVSLLFLIEQAQTMCGLVSTIKGLSSPGGRIDRGESGLEAARRELQEETDIERCLGFFFKGDELWLDSVFRVRRVFVWKGTLVLVTQWSKPSFEKAFNKNIDRSKLYRKSGKEIIGLCQMTLNLALRNSDTISYAKTTLDIAQKLLRDSFDSSQYWSGGSSGYASGSGYGSSSQGMHHRPHSQSGSGYGGSSQRTHDCHRSQGTHHPSSGSGGSSQGTHDRHHSHGTHRRHHSQSSSHGTHHPQRGGSRHSSHH